MATHETLGLILVRNGVLSRPQLYDALRLQRTTGRLLGTCLIELGYVADDALLGFLSQQLHAPICVRSELFDPDPSALKRMSAERARALLAVPYGWHGPRLRLAIANGAILPRIGELAIELRCELEPSVALETDVDEALRRYYAIESAAPVPPARKAIDPVPVPLLRAPQIEAEAGFWSANPVSGGSRDPVASLPAEDPLAPADVGVGFPTELPRKADPPTDPPLERLGLYDAVEQVYEARTPGQIGRCVGRALLNYFSRVLVFRRGERTLGQLVGHSGVTPQFSTVTLESPSAPVSYGRLDEVPGAEALARELRIGRAASAMIATVGTALVFYADNEAMEERYEELHDLEMLFKEADTALGLLPSIR